MRIVFLTRGSRGDIQPCILFGIALKKANADYEVVIATHSVYQATIEKYNLEFFSLPGDPYVFMHSMEGQKLLSSGNSLEFVRRMKECFPPCIKEIEEACRNADVILPATICYEEGFSVAEKFGIKLIRFAFIPFAMTSTKPSPLFGLPNLGRCLNKMTHLLVYYVWWKKQRPVINGWRKEKSLPLIQNAFGINPIVKKQRIPVIYSISPHVVTKPKDWPITVRFCGYLFMPSSLEDHFTSATKEEKQKETLKLEKFIENGDPPVYFGFGSMPVLDGAKLLKMVMDLMNILGWRAVFCAGWTKVEENSSCSDELKALLKELEQNQSSIIVVESTNHNWLFPRCRVIVHHGGASTTASSLRSGIPTLICPLMADQPFWGKVVYQMGCGPRPIKFKDINKELMLKALRFADKPTIRAKSKKLGQLIQEEGDGLSRAAEIFHQQVSNTSAPKSEDANISTIEVLSQEIFYPEVKIIILIVIVLFLVLISSFIW